jgi:hypothetical protein
VGNNESTEKGLVSHAGPVAIDWPRTLGYYGGISVAVAFEVIDPPLAIFVAAIPFFTMLDLPRAPRPVRFVAQVLQGASMPLGGGGPASTGPFWLTTPGLPHPERTSIIHEARQLRDQLRGKRQGARPELAAS